MKLSKILPIQSFIEQDFYESGYQDGFGYHTETVMNTVYDYRAGFARGAEVYRAGDV